MRDRVELCLFYHLKQLHLRTSSAALSFLTNTAIGQLIRGGNGLVSRGDNESYTRPGVGKEAWKGAALVQI